VRFGRRPPARLDELKAALNRADEAGDVAGGTTALETITTEFPDLSWAWYDLGLRHKWFRNWEESCTANLRALELIDERAESPEAWNLGIAATALGDWATARMAWAAFGIDIDGEGDHPIRMDFGLTPVRLNPDPRFLEPDLLIDGVRYDPNEVVWARRLCPARAMIESVPFPESGHRFGDVVLHDGDPVGERRYGDGVRAVFNEIALLERSPWETLSTEIGPVGDDALTELSDLFLKHGFGAECWTTNVQVLCKACSEGAVGERHDHPPDEEPERRATGYVVGIGGPADEADRLLDLWAAAGPGRERGVVEPA
jgi:hypothetical protein